MKTITLICREPGFRRLGIAHEHSRSYDEGHWTDRQLDQLRADPMFEVIETELTGGAPIPNVERPGVGGDYLGVGSQPFALSFDVAALEADLVEECRAAVAQSGGTAGYQVAIGSILRKYGLAHAAVDDFHRFGGLLDVGAVREPAAVAPGADASDAVQDNGAGPTVNDLGAKPAGVGEAAGIVTADGVKPPVFDDARIQSIRSAIAGLGPDADVASHASQRKLKRALGFEPSVEEIAAARVEAIAPGAIAGT